MSVPQMPTRWTRTSASPVPGAFGSSISTRSKRPGCCRTIAFTMPLLRCSLPPPYHWIDMLAGPKPHSSRGGRLAVVCHCQSVQDKYPAPIPGVSDIFARLTDPTHMPSDAQLDKLKFDANGLIPIIVQDHANGEVLMMAFMNREAIERTIATGKVHTYSRSRSRLALKGESSRHFQHVKEIYTDCDRDVVLIKVVQDVAACHEGYRSCFFRKYEAGSPDWKTTAEKVFDPSAAYSHADSTK